MYNHYNIKDEIKPEEIIMYLRKSRADDPLLSVEEVLSKHETMLDEWCEKNLSAPIPPENRYKEVVSGESIADRPAFQRVLQLLESPKYKAVLVIEIARLGRPDTMEIGRISKTFRFTNSLVITPMRTFNIADEYDRDMFEQELKRGNFYLEYTKKILSRGRALSVKSGNYVSSMPVYGYDKTTIMEGKRKCPTLAINEEEANVVRLIFNTYVNENVGTQVIANRLNALNIKSPRGQKWSPDSIRGILENIHYTGMVKWNQRKSVQIVENGEFRKTRPLNNGDDYIICKGKHEAIISEEVFNAAQEKRGRNHRSCANKELRNPFASILYCSCGKAMTHKPKKKVNGKERGEARLVCNSQPGCDNGSCTLADIEDFVADSLKQKIAEFEVEVNNKDDESIKLHDKLIAKLEKKLVDIDSREMAMWKSQFDPDPNKHIPTDIFQRLRADLTAEKEETTQALEKAKLDRPTPIDYEKRIVTFQKALDALLDKNMSAAEKNLLLKECISRIDYHRDKPIKIRGKGAGRNWSQPPIELNMKLKV